MGYEGVDLYEDSTNEKWKRVINYFRNSVEATNKEDQLFIVRIRKADFIHGAMTKEEKLIPKDKNQLCIKDISMSIAISNHLIGVVYINRRAK